MKVSANSEYSGFFPHSKVMQRSTSVLNQNMRKSKQEKILIGSLSLDKIDERQIHNSPAKSKMKLNTAMENLKY